MGIIGDSHIINLWYGLDLKPLNVDNMECYWYERTDTEGLSEKYNIIGWRSEGADYLMEVLDGSFNSMEEAARIAKSVIETK